MPQYRRLKGHAEGPIPLGGQRLKTKQNRTKPSTL